MIDIEGELYLDVQEAAARLGVKPETLYAYVSRGRLKSFRRGVGRGRLYLKAEIDALLSLQLEAPARPPLAAEPPAADPAAKPAADAAPPSAFPAAERWAAER